MKKLSIFICTSILIVIFQCCSVDQKKSDITIQVNAIHKFDVSKIEPQTGTFFSANICLLNNTDSTIYFWTMNCSWQQNWIFSTDILHFYYQDCTRNFPVINELNKGDKFIINGVIRILCPLDQIKGKSFKLGFILVKKQEVKSVFDFQRVLVNKFKIKKDIIWSEPFKIIE